VRIGREVVERLARCRHFLRGVGVVGGRPRASRNQDRNETNQDQPCPDRGTHDSTSSQAANLPRAREGGASPCGQPAPVTGWSLAAALLSAAPHRLVVLGLAVSAAARLLAAAVDGVDGRPGAPLRLVLRDPALLVALLDVLGLALLLVRVLAL